MYSFKSRVRYSEVDANSKLTLGSIVNYMQDTSTFQSEDIGLGIEYLQKEKKVWLMNSWQIIIKRLPILFEYITVSTWAYDFKRMFGYRNFTIDDKNGKHLILANSIWVFYDLEKKRPIRVTEEELHGYPIGERLDMDYAQGKIQIPENMEIKSSLPVGRYHLDTNNHVNNAQYVQIAEEFLPENFQVQSLRAEYRKSAIYGDIIKPEVGETKDGFVITLMNSPANPYAILLFNGVT